MDRLYDGWIIASPNIKDKKIDAVEHMCSYGHGNDLLEVLGNGFDDPVGYLKAEDALYYFRKSLKQDRRKQLHRIKK